MSNAASGRIDLNLGSNLLGALSGEIRARLVAAVSNPCEQTWDDAHAIILDRGSWLTLWQAVMAVDPSFPRTGPVTDQAGRKVCGWHRVPSAEVIIQAINYATR